MESLDPRAVFKTCTRFLSYKIPATETILKDLVHSATPQDRLVRD